MTQTIELQKDGFTLYVTGTYFPAEPANTDIESRMCGPGFAASFDPETVLMNLEGYKDLIELQAHRFGPELAQECMEEIEYQARKEIA
jgi:hypothetical protein